jgi:hypothetical protein
LPGAYPPASQERNEEGAQLDVNTPQKIQALAVYTKLETAKMLRVSPRKLSELVNDGRLRRLTYARQRLFSGAEILRFIEQV